MTILHRVRRRASTCRFLDALAMRLAASVLLVPVALFAQSARSTTSVAGGRLPMDPAVKMGRLANGLRYYIRPNAIPAHRAELRLVVDAGSALEDSTQRGLAHFVEHMAFNGTTHFKKLDIVRYLESMGMQFGADLNAETTFDETMYRFTVPTDRPDALPTGIRILADWAHGVTFDSAAVEAERGIILGEWRSRTGAGGVASQIGEHFLSDLMRGSRYAERMPIGLPAIIERAPRSEIARFYHDWYRPDRMAVIVVGNVDATKVEALIRRELGPIPPVTRARSQPSLVVPVPRAPTYTVMADSQVLDASAAVAYRLPQPVHGTVEGVRQGLIEYMVANVMRERLSDADLGTIALEDPVRTMRIYSLRAAAYGGDLGVALARALAMVRQMAEHGVTPDELERVRQYMLGEYERRYAERAATTSGTIADALAKNFLTGAAALNAEQWLVTVRNALSGKSAITLAEVNAAARATFDQEGRVVFITGTRSPGGMPTEQAIARLMDSSAQPPASPSAAPLESMPFVSVPPAAGHVDSTRTLASIGATEWVLSNGAHVIVKPTNFNASQILLRAVAPGGTSVAADSEYIEAHLATQALGTSGVGAFSLPVIQKRLNSTAPSVSVTPFIEELNQGVSASASPRDLETMLQLVYLTFTAPRADTAAISAWRVKIRQQLASGDATTSQAIQSHLTGGAPQARPITAAMIDSLDIGRTLAFDRARFADASAYTFYIVGAVEPNAIRSLVERYLGGLPATRARETWRDTGVRPATGPHTINAEVAPPGKTTMQLALTGPMTYDASTNMLVNAIGQVAQRRLLDRLRTDLHETYSVQVSTSAAPKPYPHFEIDVTFDAKPESADSLARAALAVLDTLRANGPTVQEVEEIKAAEARGLQLGLRDNGYWLGMLSDDGWNGWDYTTGLTDVEALLGVLTPARMRDAAQHFLDTSHVIQIAIRPRPVTS